MALSRGALRALLSTSQHAAGAASAWAAHQQHGLLAAAAATARPLTTSVHALYAQPHGSAEGKQGAAPGSSQQSRQEQQQAGHAGNKHGAPPGGSSSASSDTNSTHGSQGAQAGSSGGASNSSSTSGQDSKSGADPRIEDMTQRLFKSFRSGYQNVRLKVENASKESNARRDRRLLQEAAKEMQAVFKADGHIRSATRMYTGPTATTPAQGEAGGPSELVLTKQRPSTWQKIHERLGGLPLFNRLGSVKETAAYKKTKEMYEDMRERYENTDHPAVHKIDDLKDRLVSGSEGSRAMREIRTRDPSFDMNNFVRAVKLDAPVVSKAFLNHDLATLKLHCAPELVERFSGIFRHFSEQGLFEDPTILFVGDVEVVEIKLLDDDPFAIIQFHCQQLKCTRDRFGNVIEGATDSIQRVYYFWGLQQEKQGVVTAEGQLLPPRWVIKDMMWQSMLALV